MIAPEHVEHGGAPPGEPEPVRVTLHGAVTGDDAAAARGRLIHAVHAHAPARVSVDMGEVSSLDNQGIAAIVDAYRAASRAGGSLRLIGSSPELVRILQDAGLAAALLESH